MPNSDTPVESTSTPSNKWFNVVLLLGLGVLFGVGISYIFTHQSPKRLPYFQHESGYTLINPLLSCEADLDSTDMPTVSALQSKIHTYIDSVKKNQNVSNVSVYFRDLNNGPWFGIDQDLLFSPASMLKVLMLISVNRAAESDPSLWDKTAIMTEDIDEIAQQGQFYVPAKQAEVNTTYTVRELVQLMIEYSDNGATELLHSVIPSDIVEKTYADLGIIINRDTPFENFLSVKDYAGVFRILFNSTYLSREGSESALNLLTQTDFSDGLTKQLPSSVLVAHKFGEKRINIAGQDVETQLHDCGIIYHPHSPYLLCVMTRGDNFETLSETIGTLSTLAYESW